MNRITLLGIAACGVLATVGVKGFTTLRQKAQQQDSSTEVISRWKSSYKALEASSNAWKARYPSLSNYNDLLSLYRSLRLESYRLTGDPDRLALTENSAVQHNGTDLGLMRICLASTAEGKGAPFVVTADSYALLLEGINGLTSRPDIAIGSITVKGAGSRPTAELSDFCVLLREENTA